MILYFQSVQDTNQCPYIFNHPEECNCVVCGSNDLQILLFNMGVLYCRSIYCNEEFKIGRDLFQQLFGHWEKKRFYVGMNENEPYYEDFINTTGYMFWYYSHCCRRDGDIQQGRHLLEGADDWFGKLLYRDPAIECIINIQIKSIDQPAAIEERQRNNPSNFRTIFNKKEWAKKIDLKTIEDPVYSPVKIQKTTLESKTEKKKLPITSHRKCASEKKNYTSLLKSKENSSTITPISKPTKFTAQEKLNFDVISNKLRLKMQSTVTTNGTPVSAIIFNDNLPVNEKRNGTSSVKKNHINTKNTIETVIIESHTELPVKKKKSKENHVLTKAKPSSSIIISSDDDDELPLKKNRNPAKPVAGSSNQSIPKTLKPVVTRTLRPKRN